MDQYITLNLTHSGKILVLFSYNNNDEMRLCRMHSECLMVDATHGSNNQRKELFTVAVKNGNNKAFNACRAFIPNQQ